MVLIKIFVRNSWVLLLRLSLLIFFNYMRHVFFIFWYIDVTALSKYIYSTTYLSFILSPSPFPFIYLSNCLSIYVSIWQSIFLPSLSIWFNIKPLTTDKLLLYVVWHSILAFNWKDSTFIHCNCFRYISVWYPQALPD